MSDRQSIPVRLQWRLGWVSALLSAERHPIAGFRKLCKSRPFGAFPHASVFWSKKVRVKPITLAVEC